VVDQKEEIVTIKTEIEETIEKLMIHIENQEEIIRLRIIEVIIIQIIGIEKTNNTLRKITSMI
jgi:hypothetical protein